MAEIDGQTAFGLFREIREASEKTLMECKSEMKINFEFENFLQKKIYFVRFVVI
jgi:hypothetical protein